ncbi:family 78 glycoside hydrolase catalytic domain [uncultured Alistipes sp.]|uniref:family 78 glycoside hydrolase catalytic domain n=1 Tax=uncultured Alistipes sp. TaxID=538949 RepID=UPI002623BF66|nr:family 78 glycoside hydrolase catalytic domain [uncultured Alistipes sp.]
MRRNPLSVFVLSFVLGPLSPLYGGAPARLTTDLIEHTDRVWLDGCPTQVSLADVPKTIEPVEFVEIASRRPMLGWQVEDTRRDVMQTAYRVLVATSERLLAGDSADMWDSGEVASDRSVAVEYSGRELQPSTVYYWKVRTSNNGTLQPWSAVRAFRTAASLSDYATPAYPLERRADRPVARGTVGEGTVFVDFGRAAFGRVDLTVRSESGEDTLTVRLGECLREGRIDPAPGGSRRFLAQRIALLPGCRTYTLKIPADPRNTDGGGRAVRMPSLTGEVYPFRYCEIEGTAPQNVTDVCRRSVHYPFDDRAARFASSDTTLDRVWEMCRYSIEATSFAGLYVDGDRERIPYEADALINQLAHYCVDREFTMARRSHEYLLDHATWPTEWIMQSILIAWYDYLYTGDGRALARYYDRLRHRTLRALADGEGFIRVTDEAQTPELHTSIGLSGQKLQTIVDWPHTGILGLGKAEGGETDGFVFREVNTVANAYHYEALRTMALIAATLGRSDDAAEYDAAAASLRRHFNRRLFDRRAGAYRDGVGTDHHSLHANMFPLCFGMAEAKDVPSILRFVRSRGMACSVYGAQFLLDALYVAGEDGYALDLMRSDAERSWYNMIRAGSTVSMEAWADRYKPNQDWNHAWGAAPANVIPRQLMGVKPVEAGFSRIEIRPRPGDLRTASLRMPSVRGDIGVAFENGSSEFVLRVDVPANMRADVFLPLSSSVRDYELTEEGKPVEGALREGNFVKIPDTGSGARTYVLKTK